MDNFPLPPILPDIEDELKSYLLCPEKLPMHDYRIHQKLWHRDINLKDLLHFNSSPLNTTLKVQRDPNTGEIIDFHEVPLQSAGATAQNSMSLSRAPLSPDDAVRGSASVMPFWPGSFPNPIDQLPEQQNRMDDVLLTVPPGFTHGLTFASDGRTVLSESPDTETKFKLDGGKNIVNILDLVQDEEEFSGPWNTSKKETTTENTKEEHVDLPEEDEVIPKESQILNISTAEPLNKLKGTEWAVLLSTAEPVENFESLIPEMAYKFPFKLDTFQQLAILQLEQHNHVFVAAHTSAGKTVVAEYAIALSQKHMTRTIYTSPIKALSNQKYRDFKQKFNDVGLITGDFQINETASCLIMTTEILRTMLYCGSDITRDLEYVIFDEVHYINDRERGHVWEQVLILLPAHVCVVLLSATVPNTVEFADWLGRTHQRKVYVITTSQRPVPLKHYLYAVTGTPNKDQRCLVLNQGKWLLAGYNKAKNLLDSMREKESKTKVQYPKNRLPLLTPKQEKTLWVILIDHLKRNNLLPVVAFTFSRAKCDANAENLICLDLTTQKEKAHIRYFFEKCVNSLKEPDRQIPQILRMRELLYNGIGVHHSGILPIIKEIVEMLFQGGFIKLLFATETFAMGVNMPARTVVFDSVMKHDGQKLRNLLPAEYIQMAGRAGRRGLDEEGTVIILCKKKVPTLEDLQVMMMGKPNILQSQFRLTYGMVLSLLRVERLTVEGMMSRSFREADHQKKLVEIREQHERIEEKIKEMYAQELSSYLQPLVQFYESCSNFIRFKEKIMNRVVLSAKVIKVLTPGRLLIITFQKHLRKLGMLLNIVKSTKEPLFKVLVLTDPKIEISDKDNDLWFKMLALVNDNVFVPQNAPGHEVLTIKASDISEITDRTLKNDPELILKDWEKRQIERFRLDPPGQTFAAALQELHKLSLTADFTYLHFIRDLKVNEKDIYDDLLYFYTLEDEIIDHLPSTQIPNFEEQFATVFQRTYLEEEKKELEYQLSNASLSLYPDYENRIELLRLMKYVDNQNRVQLKGRVACEIGRNELLITELVLRNVLTKLKPAEVAALLSALVFSPKKNNVVEDFSELTPDLQNGIKEMSAIHLEIANLEMSLSIKTEEIQNELNFALVFIVFEWASAKPFAEIMKLTDIQEGIIVRSIQQLNDTICDVRNAARIIGDPELQSKMDEASVSMKRDIVFAASLYTNP